MAGADVIMSQTLPTVIGMGVVSRSTETMFGGRGRKTKSRRTKSKIGGRVVHVGKRGGRYVIKNRRRVYI